MIFLASETALLNKYYPGKLAIYHNITRVILTLSVRVHLEQRSFPLEANAIARPRIRPPGREHQGTEVAGRQNHRRITPAATGAS